MSLSESVELGVAAEVATQQPERQSTARRVAAAAFVPALIALALLGASFVTSSARTTDQGAKQFGATLARLGSEGSDAAATYDDCTILKMGAHACVTKTTTIGDSDLSCHELSNYGLDRYCKSENKTVTARAENYARKRIEAGEECDMIEMFLSTCFSTEGIFCEAYSIEASVAATSSMGCSSSDADSTSTSRKTPWFSNDDDKVANATTPAADAAEAAPIDPSRK